jgi:hypothetical protein
MVGVQHAPSATGFASTARTSDESPDEVCGKLSPTSTVQDQHREGGFLAEFLGLSRDVPHDLGLSRDVPHHHAAGSGQIILTAFRADWQSSTVGLQETLSVCLKAHDDGVAREL